MLFGLHMCCLVGSLSSEEVSSSVWSSGTDGHAAISEAADLGQREVQAHQTLMRTERAEDASLASMEVNSKAKAGQQAQLGWNQYSNYGQQTLPVQQQQPPMQNPPIQPGGAATLTGPGGAGMDFEKFMSWQPPAQQSQPGNGQFGNNYVSVQSSYGAPAVQQPVQSQSSYGAPAWRQQPVQSQSSYGAPAVQQPVQSQSSYGAPAWQQPVQSPLMQPALGQPLGQARPIFPKSSDRTRHHGRGLISPEQEAQDDAMPLDPDDPKAGARCVIPMWSTTLYACEEHEEVPQLNTFTDGNGVQRKALEDGDDCTVICPSPRWWQTPSEETVTCKDGTFHVENGTRVKEIECGTSTGFTLMSLLLFVVIAGVSASIWLGKEEMMRLYDENLARHLGPLPSTKHDEHDDGHPEHSEEEADHTDKEGKAAQKEGEEAKKDVQPESGGKDAQKEGEQAKKDVQPESGGIKQDGASASGS